MAALYFVKHPLRFVELDQISVWEHLLLDGPSSWSSETRLSFRPTLYCSYDGRKRKKEGWGDEFEEVVYRKGRVLRFRLVHRHISQSRSNRKEQAFPHAYVCLYLIWSIGHENKKVD